MTATVEPTTTYAWHCEACHDHGLPCPDQQTAQQWADLHNHYHHTENNQ